jgi:phosphate transport system substrate-binding protein
VAGEFSWPITGASFILVPRAAPDADRERMVLRFFDWAVHRGVGSVEQLDYAPVPQSVIDRLPVLWQAVRDASGRAVWP